MKIIFVICEGKSEISYLQELNKEFNEEDIPVSFIPKHVGNGCFSRLKKKWLSLQSENKSTFRHWRKERNIFFLADWDLFHRNENESRTHYEKQREELPPFYFNYHNFEDFLSLHLPVKQAAQWCQICVARNHFEAPMHGSEYEPLFKELVHGYRKGSLPENFTMKEGLQNLKNNIADARIHQKSDFADYLLKEVLS